jgi:ABC-type transport system involved in multi-copper enzyme maturation permease subunit
MSLVLATRAEYTKQFTTAMWWILGVVLVAYLGLVGAGLAFTLAATATGALSANNGAAIPAEHLAGIVYSIGASLGYVFPLLVGTLMVTSEYRHKTLTPTFLATPHRGTVISAKVIIGLVIGALYGVLTVIVSVGPPAGILAGYDIKTALDSGDTWAMLGRIVLAFALWALVGLGVGALVRNQVAAIVIVLAFTQFIGPIASAVGSLVKGLDSVTQYLPGAASDALVGQSIYAIAGTGQTAGLEWWAGGLVLAGYAVVLIVLGWLFGWRRDID